MKCRIESLDGDQGDVFAATCKPRVNMTNPKRHLEATTNAIHHRIQSLQIERQQDLGGTCGEVFVHVSGLCAVDLVFLVTDMTEDKSFIIRATASPISWSKRFWAAGVKRCYGIAGAALNRTAHTIGGGPDRVEAETTPGLRRK